MIKTANFKRKNLIGICMIFLLVMTYAVVYSGIEDASDYIQHYIFAEELSLLKKWSLPDFLANVPNSKILSYPVWHIICYAANAVLAKFGISGILIDKVIIAGVTSVFEILTYVSLLYALSYFIKNEECKDYCGAYVLILLIEGPLFIPKVNQNYYLGQLTANPWHNPTTIAVKAISILCFVFYTKLFRKFDNQEKISIKEILTVGSLLAFSALCKPSFYQMFVPGLALACFIELICTKGRALWFDIQMFFSVLPVMVVSLVQMKLSFVEQGNGIGFKLWYVVGMYSSHPGLSFLISIPFVVFVCILTYKDLIRDKMMLISVCAFLSGALQYALLYQTQDAGSGNFAWGAYLGLGLLNISALCKFIDMDNKGRLVKFIGWCILGLQVFFGFAYMIRIIKMGGY